MPQNFDDHQPGLESPPSSILAISAAASDFSEGATRGINASEDTTITCRTADAPATDLVGYQLHKGYNPGRFVRVSVITSGNLWALR